MGWGWPRYKSVTPLIHIMEDRKKENGMLLTSDPGCSGAVGLIGSRLPVGR